MFNLKFLKNKKGSDKKTLFTKQTGFIKLIIIIIGALVLLKYTYDIDVVGFLTTGKFKDWLDKIYNISSAGWQKYYTVIIKVWNYAIELIKNLIAKIK